VEVAALFRVEIVEYSGGVRLGQRNGIRDQDMVCVGTMTPDEAREVIDLSLDFLSRRLPDNELQFTRNKRSLLG